MALTTAERKAAAAAAWWGPGLQWGLRLMGREEDLFGPEAMVARLRGVPFAVCLGSGLYPGRVYVRGEAPDAETLEALDRAHGAMVDVAKFLGYRDRGDEPAEIQYLAGMEKNAAALRARFEGLVAGKPRSSLPALPRPSMLEGG